MITQIFYDGLGAPDRYFDGELFYNMNTMVLSEPIRLLLLLLFIHQLDKLSIY